eukprot:1032346-Rhodomonas_salina.2
MRMKTLCCEADAGTPQTHHDATVDTNADRDRDRTETQTQTQTCEPSARDPSHGLHPLDLLGSAHHA